ncbi:MAG TPA: acyl-CoA reductase [Longimicrobiales bacterium]|nr:acyl-CoA reductase [Longimicrobiales bacterium]
MAEPFAAFATPRALPPTATRTLEASDEASGGAPPLGVAEASADWVRSLAAALAEAGGALRARPAAEVARALGRVGARFLDSADELRARALALLPAASGLSPAVSEAVLDGMAADWTEERLLRLLDVELGGPAALDGFIRREGREQAAFGPRLCVQVVAGSVPGVGVSALLRSLLLKAPTLLKPGRGDVVLPVLWARALREADPALADALAVVYWKGGSVELEEAALSSADVVVAYGSDATVRALRARAPATARFVGYAHRVSVGVIGREALGATEAREAARVVAHAVAILEQRGCVSPRVIHVEEGGETPPQAFAELLATALEETEARLPGPPLELAERTALRQLRDTAELLAASDPERTRVRHGGSASWTVVYQAGAERALDGPGRLVLVRPVSDARDLTERLAPLATPLQTVGFAGMGARTEEVARALGALGASRVVPFEAGPFPPAWWHHDGRGPLLDLVRWTDLERA